MKACLITIGNEILKGRTVNTNAAYIGKFLTSRGFEVQRGITVMDDLDEIKWAIDAANGYYDLIVTTGGLGPTFDDMTVEGVAKALGLKLVNDQPTLEMLKERYRKINAELTPERLKLALIPEGARTVKNTVGAAPGVWIELDSTRILILPGVPREMEAILGNAESLVGRDTRFYYDETRHMPGVMESTLAPIVSRIMNIEKGSVYIKSHPLRSETNKPEIDVEVSAYAYSEEEAEKKVKDTFKAMLDELDLTRIDGN